MQFFFEGLLLGLSLSILIGPILIALTQTSIEYGVKAGLIVGAGIWISDLIVITLVWVFLHRIAPLVHHDGFMRSAGITGSIVLISLGVFTIFKSANRKIPKPIKINIAHFTGFFFKGFAVNFINPFTFAFWISVISTYLLAMNVSDFQLSLLLCGIMVVIVSTDTLKVLLPKLIRSKLQPEHILLFSRISGFLLILFGIVLIFRSF
ncbi:MAG: LysE family transporter [Saprospiraceae bacterium]|nr:MAG: lysine exporter protein LysE/YggA [Bacteroidetes bacterium OLB9]MCO6464711.1 LysE family transporter [Saprospiraceae bacterium]